ncbi:hypothetical protein [Streptomyces sp. NPDC001315]|uniref:hypothetical protein n=1 Tax=Streptomyces sp. NPDC001315 TaxID=3364562 RepID=UPI003693D8B1
MLFSQEAEFFCCLAFSSCLVQPVVRLAEQILGVVQLFLYGLNSCDLLRGAGSVTLLFQRRAALAEGADHLQQHVDEAGSPEQRVLRRDLALPRVVEPQLQFEGCARGLLSGSDRSGTSRSLSGLQQLGALQQLQVPSAWILDQGCDEILKEVTGDQLGALAELGPLIALVRKPLG